MVIGGPRRGTSVISRFGDEPGTTPYLDAGALFKVAALKSHFPLREEPARSSAEQHRWRGKRSRGLHRQAD